MRRIRLAAALAFAVTVAGAPFPALVRADEPAAIDVALAGGATIRGVVESTDAQEVVLRVGPEERRRVPWTQLAPVGVLAVRASQVKPDDGPGRLALAELASELGLWAQARVEYEKAAALGALDAAALATAVADAERRAVEAGIVRAERAADAGDLAKALEIVRGLKLDFARAIDPERVDALVRSVEARIAARDADLKKAQDDLDKLALDVDRKREILGRMTEAKRQIAWGDKAAKEARELFPRGVVSKVGRLIEAADEAYGAARRELGRLRRIVRKEEAERDQVLALLNDLDRLQYRVLFDAAKFFWSARVYARADEYAARASYLDPVDPALLELRAEIRNHRIRYRFSDVTNARPITR
jgi:hypothetical protein